MKFRFKRYLYTILILLLFSVQSSAVDKTSEDYGSVHKLIFNNPDNCTLCHLYNNFDSDKDRSKKNNPSHDEDIYDYDDDDDNDDDDQGDGVMGWFFGRKKKTSTPEAIDISEEIFYSYRRSGFVNDDKIMPHEFVRPITGMCMTDECHTDYELGNSHAVDISPYERYPDMKVPKEYPLYWDTDKYKELITCGTCHNPHLDWLYPEPLQKIHKPVKRIKGKKYYSTFFVRVRSLEHGLFTLCKGCHEDY